MTDFNALPLAEKIDRANVDDFLITDTGCKIIIADIDSVGSIGVSIFGDYKIWIPRKSITDIIRPTARKVPEVVEWLKEEMEEIIHIKDRQHPFDICPLSRFSELLRVLADHFERTP